MAVVCRSLASSLDELEESIQKSLSALQISSDVLQHPLIPITLRDIHFQSPALERLHIEMIRLFDRLESATTEEKDAVFRYFRLMTIEWHFSFAPTLEPPLTLENAPAVKESDNPLVTWYPGVTDLILSFLEPTETMSLLALSSVFYANFWQRCVTLLYTSLTLGHPWHRCPAETRRRLFPRFSGIRTLRIGPAAACVFDGEDLDDILRRSSQTLQRLHICSPCEALFLANPLAMTRKNSRGQLAPEHDEQDALNGDGKVPTLGSNARRSSSDLHSRSLTELTALELTGNDALQWAATALRWNVPNLKTLTLQTWTDDLCANGKIIGNDRKTEEPKERKQTAERVNSDEDDLENVKTGQSQRQLVFEALVNNVSSTIWELEFLVPGWKFHVNCKNDKYSPVSNTVDFVSRRDSSDDDDDNSISQQESESQPFERESMKEQFEDFWKLLERILFDKKFTYLRKVQFLGMSNLNFAIIALRAALSAEYYSNSLEPFDKICRQRSSLSSARTSDELPIHHQEDENSDEESMSRLMNEPDQPFLPVLDFQENWDGSQGYRIDPECGGINNCTKWPSVLLPPIGRSLLVFSGLLQWPAKSCIEFTCLYPLCVQQSSGLKLPTTEDRRRLSVETDITESTRLSSDSASDQPLQMAYSQLDSVVRSILNMGTKSDHSSDGNESKDRGIAKDQVMMKLRVQHECGVQFEREFQRLRSIEMATREKFLRPSAGVSRKGKPPSKKKLILDHHESPQDASDIISQFSESVTELGIFLGDHRATVRLLSVMRFPLLSSLRLVNWNGLNKSHLSLFNLVAVSPPRQVHLTVETTEAHYEPIRRDYPRAFYASLIRFVLNLKRRGMLIDRISFFPGPEQEFVANMNYFFPVKRLHVAVPPWSFFSPFESYEVPRCLFTVFPSSAEDSGANIERSGQFSSTAEALRQSAIAREGSLPPTPPQLTINSEVLEVVEPIERRYSTIREFLVDEVEKQSETLPYPSPLLMTVAWKDASLSEIDGILPLGVTGEAILEHLVQVYSSGTFFSDEGSSRNVQLTLSCDMGLEEFYKTIISLRSLSVCTFTERPFHEVHMLLQFDSQRYGSSGGPKFERGDWLVESIFLPWLFLVEIFMGLGYCTAILSNVPTISNPINVLLDSIQSHGPGFCFQWLNNKDLAVVVLNPRDWSQFLCQWTLRLARGNLGQKSLLLLKGKAE